MLNLKKYAVSNRHNYYYAGYTDGGNNSLHAESPSVTVVFLLTPAHTL